MPDFRYVARTADGRRVEGVVSTNDRSAAIAQVEQERLISIRIESVLAKAQKQKDGKTAAPATTDGPAIQTLGHTHLFLFTEQLAHLLGAGMTLDEALDILVRRLKHPRLQRLSQALHQALVDGRSLSQALRDYPRIFSPLYVN